MSTETSPAQGGIGSGLKQRTKAVLQDAFLRQAVAFTTNKLRTGRLSAAEEFGDWETWRSRGQAIRQHTIEHLDYYLGQFAEQAERRGARVHFCGTGGEAVQVFLAIAKEKQAKLVAKGKSMVSEEMHLNERLHEQGIDAIETDLGEYILQLAKETPSHLIIPAIHKNKSQIAELFTKEAGKPLPPETKELAAFAKRKLRQFFLEVDIGLSGCNFGIAESGTVTIVSNEGNGRMVTTLPKTHVVVMGMERLVPTFDDVEVMLNLLARSATGQKLTTYTSFITGPRQRGDLDGPEELHIIILDNGRSAQLGDPQFQQVLHCIRCAACLNVCPVYRHVGGHTYGSVYSGPIGAVLTPLLQQDMKEAGTLAYASSLCGACYEACPVKIPLHDMLVHLRARKVKEGYTPQTERLGFQLFGKVFSHVKWYRMAGKAAYYGQKPLVRGGVIRKGPGPLGGWTASRTFPAIPKQSFRDRWDELQAELVRADREQGLARTNREQGRDS
ncbi:LutB/LldF family L-lactate oxidation iron-sulfur protein [Paenibacillus thiaminolyticus]|uniref:LutB/LldF family L-lactate oxidation iron-sulfur protein n=1 Tax=Paenibacillus thiaminolyticus TaxID=49283 RepID=UPI003D2A633F